MKLSAQEEYGLRCLLFMARNGDTVSFSIPEISKAEGLSVPNVAKLMRLLRIGGFVASTRGQSGGYTLACPANEISVGSVLETLGGKLFSAGFCHRHAGKEKSCVHSDDCSMRALWTTIQRVLEGVLNDTTLADLLRNETSMQEWVVAKTSSVMPTLTSLVNGHAASETVAAH